MAVVDWNLVVILVIINGVVDAAGVSYLAGWWSKRRLVAWLNAPESNPYVERIAKKAGEQVLALVPHVPSVEEVVRAIAAKLPDVPSLEEISNEMRAAIPPIPPYPEVPDYTDRLNLLEERIGARLTVAMDSKWAALQEGLSQRVGQVVQANIASAKAAFSSANRELADSMDPDNDGSMLTEVLGIFMDEDSIKKVGRARRLMKQFQARGGMGGSLGSSTTGAASQAYAYGTILNGWVATPQGWKQIAVPAPAALPVPSLPLAAAPVTAKDMPPELPPA